jgi:hypothetical protein
VPIRRFQLLDISQSVSAIQKALSGISQRVTSTLLAWLQVSPRAFRLISAFTSMCWHTFRSFVHLTQSNVLYYFRVEIKYAIDNFETASEVLLLIMLYQTIPLLTKLRLVRESIYFLNNNDLIPKSVNDLDNDYDCITKDAK